MAYDTILYEKKGKIAHITQNLPRKIGKLRRIIAWLKLDAESSGGVSNVGGHYSLKWSNDDYTL